MVNFKKKGFTIIELVIVVAVIAILAAVLIPTFSSIVKKSKIAADVQTVRNLNTIVASEGVEVGGIKTAHDAIVAASNNGYDVAYISPTVDGRTIAWDGANYRFVLLDNDELVFPKDDKPETDKSNLFVVSDSQEANGYAVYLKEGYTGTELSVATGIDVGYNEQITKITYTGTAEVAIRGGQYTTIVVNSGTVHHYDVAWTAYVAEGATYHEHGTLHSELSEGAPVETGFAGGSGTENDPYLISNISQLQNSVFTSSSNSGYYKLISDIDLTNATRVESHGADIMIGYYLYNSVFDGNGHTITIANGSKGLFADTENSTIKNLTVNFDNCSGYSTVSMYLENSTIENVITEGSVTDLMGNTGLLSYYSYEENTYRNCVNNANITGASGNTNISIFGGYLRGSSAIYENCVNNGIVKGSQAAMFASCANPGSKLTVINCKNDGTIHYMLPRYSTTTGNVRPENYYVAYKAFQLDSLTVNGLNKDIETNEAITGNGVCVVGTNDINITLNNDGTLTINADNVTPTTYEITALIYGYASDGSTLKYELKETITCNGATSYTSEIKLLPFVDSDNTEYTAAGDLAGNYVVTDAEGNLYYVYPVTTIAERTFRLKDGIAYISSLTVSALDSSKNVVAASTYIPE